MSNPLEDRIAELMDISKALYPDTPEWYIKLSVEAYIKQEEPELLIYAETVEEEEKQNHIYIEEVAVQDEVKKP